jgi:hypothetical protein
MNLSCRWFGHVWIFAGDEPDAPLVCWRCGIDKESR